MRNWNYRTKFIILCIASIILFVIIYQLAVSETLSVRHKLTDNEKKLQLIEKAPAEISSIKSKLDNISSFMGGEFDTTYRNEPLLDFLSQVCRMQHTVLADFQPTHISDQGDFRVETRIAILEGKYFDLLKALYDIENKYLYGRLVSAGFNLKEDFRSNQKRLYLTVYIQTIQNITQTNNSEKI